MANNANKKRELIAMLAKLVEATRAMRRDVERVDRLLAAAHRKQ